VKTKGGEVQKEYSSDQNLVGSDEEIVQLLKKSDTEFSELGISGVFLK
jgi:hypothetical protein